MGTASGRGTLLAAVLASGMVFLDSTVVNVALPRLGADLGATVAGLQWTVNGYLLMLAAFVLLGGALGDRFGRRRIFLLGVVWFTVASAALRAGPGHRPAGRGPVPPGRRRRAAHPRLALGAPGQLPPRRPGPGRSAPGPACPASPPRSARFVGGWLIDALSWRWIFFLNVPLAVLVVLAALRWVPESRDEEASRTEGPAPAPPVRRGRGAARRGRPGRLHVRPDRRPRARLRLGPGAGRGAGRVWSARWSSCWSSGAAATARCCPPGCSAAGSSRY